MRRFESARTVRLRMPAGKWLDLWVAESCRLRLLGLAGLAGLPPERGLLLPRCRSVHTAGMRFEIDLAFVSWPPVRGGCDVVTVERAVAPLRLVALRGLAPAPIAALETAAGALPGGGVRPGARLAVVVGPVSGGGGAGREISGKRGDHTMFERFRRHKDAPDRTPAERTDGVAVQDRDRAAARGHNGAPDAGRNGDPVAAAPPKGTAPAERPVRRPVAAQAAADAEVRRRDEFGGLNWGATFFGWLVAIGLAALLVGIVAAAGAALGLSELSGAEARGNAETIGIVGGALLVGILALAYFAGGYVAGRMSRFDGARQGAGVWVIGLLTTIALAIAGIVGGSEYNVLERLDLPRIPIDEGDLTTGGAIALAAVLVGTLLAGMAGGRIGQRYHRRVDAAGWDVH